MLPHPRLFAVRDRDLLCVYWVCAGEVDEDPRRRDDSETTDVTGRVTHRLRLCGPARAADFGLVFGRGCALVCECTILYSGPVRLK